MSSTKTTLSLQSRLVVLAAAGALVMAGLAFWNFAHLDRVKTAAESSEAARLEFSRKIDKLKSDLAERQLALVALRGAENDDQIATMVHKVEGLNALVDQQLNALAVRDSSALERDLRFHVNIYNAAAAGFADTLRLGRYVGAADRIMTNTLAKEYVVVQRLADQLRDDYEARAQNTAVAVVQRVRSTMTWVALLLLGGVILLAGLPILMFGQPVGFLRKIIRTLDKLKFGEISKDQLPESANEVGAIAKGINAVSAHLSQSARFADDVGRGVFDSEFKLAGRQDVLGAALVGMRDRLRTVADDEKRRNWAIAGFARFGEILRANHDQQTLADQIITDLTHYIDAIQGGFFIAQENDEGQMELRLISSYAYERKKYIEKTFRLGEGLVGQAALERGVIYVTEVPANYVTITSGLGQANPRALLVTPLVANNELYGVLEFAAFQEFQPHVVEFVERMAENIASTLTNVRNNERTVKLLKESQDLTRQLSRNEGELRARMEQIDATASEMDRVQRELKAQITAINNAAIVSETNVAGDIIFANDEFCRVAKYDRSELMGKNHRILKSGDQPDEIFVDLWATVGKGQVWRGVIKNRAKDGSFYWVKATITPVPGPDGKPQKYIGVRFEITEQKAQEEIIQNQLMSAQAQEEEMRQQAEEMVATQEEMKRVNVELDGQISALNNSAIVSEANILGDIIFVNEEFIRVSKYTREELQGRNHRLLKSGHQPDELFVDLWATISQGRVWKGLVKNRAKDGSYYWVSTTVTPVLDASGKPIKYIGVRFDITDQKTQEERIAQQLEEAQSQEEEIRQNAEEMAATQEEMTRINIELSGQIGALNNSAIVSEADIAGDIIMVNDQFVRISKYNREELLGRNHRLLKSGDQPDEIFEDLWRTISAGMVWKGTIKNRAKDGTHYWVATTITPILGVDKKPTKYVGVRFDITEQKAQEERIAQALEEAQAQEEEIRQNAEEMAATQEEMARINLELSGQIGALNNSAIVSEADLAGNIIFVNDEFVRISKYSRDELIGRNHRILKSGHQPDDLFVDLWRTISAGRVWKGVVKNRAKDGTYYWVATTVTPILGADGKPTKYVGVRFDITDQKAQEERIAQALEEAQSQEEEIRQNAEEMAATQEEMARINLELSGQIGALNNSAIVSEADLAGNIVLVNDEFVRISKYTREELFGRNHRILKSGHQPDDLFVDLWRTISAGMVWKGVVKNRAKDGTYYWVATTITPILGVDKKPTKYVGVRFDITEQKAQEERIAQALEEAQAQEEEIRQNAEEMAATQEEMARINLELDGRLNAINRSTAVIEFNLSGHILNANENFLQVMGYHADEVLGKHHSMFVTEADKQSSAYQLFWENLRNGAYQKGEFQRVARDGSKVWLLGSYNPIQGSDGKPYKIVKFVTDITEQKIQEERIAQALEEAQAQEEEIRQNAEEMAATQEEMARLNLELEGRLSAINRSTAVIEFDMRGHTLTANENFLEVMGYRLDEIAGKHHSLFVTDEDKNSRGYKIFWEKLRNGLYEKGEFQRVAKDGRKVWLLGSYNPILGTDGKPYKIVKFVTDITLEREQSENIHALLEETRSKEEALSQALEESQAQEEELRQNAEEMAATQEEIARINLELKGQIGALNNAALVSEADLVGNIIYANDTFCRVAKYSREELIGRNHRILKSGHQSDDIFVELWRTITEGQVWRGLIKNKAKDGTYYWVQSTVTPVLGQDGKPYKYVGVRFEVTKQIEGQNEAPPARDLNAVANFSPDMICTLDAEGRIQEVNPAFTRHLGYTAVDVVGRPLLEFVHDRDREAVTLELLKLGRERYATQFMHRFRRPDGAYVYLSWGMVSEPELGVAHCIGRDVTELLAHGANGNGADQLMNDMKKQLAAARKTAGYLELNEKGYLQGVSDLLLRRLGYESYELIGLHLTALLSEADRPQVQTHLQQNGGAETFDQRLVLRTKDGAGVAVHAVLNFIHAFNSTKAMYVGFVELLN